MRRAEEEGTPPPPTLYEFYRENWVEFGRILTDMEKEGMLVDREHLRQAQVRGGAGSEWGYPRRAQVGVWGGRAWHFWFFF